MFFAALLAINTILEHKINNIIIKAQLIYGSFINWVKNSFNPFKKKLMSIVELLAINTTLK
jgi:hypothetical protein